MKMQLWCLAAGWALAGASARGEFHIMTVSEVLAGANGDPSIQFVELEMLDNGQQFVGGHSLTARSADGTVSRVIFTFPANAGTQLTGLAGRKILVGSRAFAQVSGLTPDFVFDPAAVGGGLFPESGQVNFAGVTSLSYGNYTGPGSVGSPAPLLTGTGPLSLQRTANTGNDSADFSLRQAIPEKNNTTTSTLRPPLRITEVDPSTGQVEVTNIGLAPFTTPSPFPFSHNSNTATSIAGGTTFAPGESKTFPVAGLNASDSDLWLYSSSGFTEGAAIISGLKYGPLANVGHTSVAAAAGIWPSTSAYVPAPAGGQSLKITAHGFADPANWGSGSPGFGSYFSTGSAIADPLPPIPKGDITISLQVVASGLAAPLGVTAPDDNSGRLFIYDQGGTVTLVLNGVQQPTPCLDVSSRLVPLGLFPPLNYDERGLLGFACHPDFATNPKVYTYTTEPAGSGPADFTTTQPAAGFDHQNVVAEWSMAPGNPGVVDPASRREILRIDHPQFNHDGGTLRFGPDGMLYISIGDGGRGDDEGEGHHPDGNAQQIDNIYGSILRINVDGSNSANGRYGIPADNPFVGRAGLDEIWAYGLRNPYAFSFDRTTGELYVGDAGQNKVEEIDVVSKGANMGWRLKEGSFFFDPNGTSAGYVSPIPDRPFPADLVDPVAEYDHDDGSAVIGGFVYRASGIPELAGKYVTGDFGGFSAPTGRLFYLDGANGLKELRIDGTDRPFGKWLKGFGDDRAGNVYICGASVLGPTGTTGVVYRIVKQAEAEGWEMYE